MNWATKPLKVHGCSCSMTSVTGSLVMRGADEAEIDDRDRADRYGETEDVGGFDQRKHVGRFANLPFRSTNAESIDKFRIKTFRKNP